MRIKITKENGFLVFGFLSVITANPNIGFVFNWISHLIVGLILFVYGSYRYFSKNGKEKLFKHILPLWIIAIIFVSINVKAKKKSEENYPYLKSKLYDLHFASDKYLEGSVNISDNGIGVKLVKNNRCHIDSINIKLDGKIINPDKLSMTCIQTKELRPIHCSTDKNFLKGMNNEINAMDEGFFVSYEFKNSGYLKSIKELDLIVYSYWFTDSCKMYIAN